MYGTDGWNVIRGIICRTSPEEETGVERDHILLLLLLL
jgi:hypothetical protein